MCGAFWGFGGHSFLWLLLLIGCLVFFLNRNRFCFGKTSADNASADLSEEVTELRREIALLKKNQNKDKPS